jgi:hypothetical protein
VLEILDSEKKARKLSKRHIDWKGISKTVPFLDDLIEYKMLRNL